MRDGKDWGMEGRSIPIVRVVGRGEDASVSARRAFNDFAESVFSQLPEGEASARPSTRAVGQQIEWTLEVQLLAAMQAEGDDASDTEGPK